MMLGDLLAAARRNSSGFLCWLDASEPELASAVRAAAEQVGEDAVNYLRGSIAAFSDRAGEEDWATLVSGLRDADDPAMVCLHTMTRWRIAIERSARHPAGDLQ